MTRAEGSLLRVGLYTKPEAARLLEIPLPKVRRWADGYTFYHGGERRLSVPVLRPQVPSAHAAGVLTFLDLIELKFVGLFREQGVSMPAIRVAARVAGDLFRTDHPFAVRKFATDGSSIFAKLERRDFPGAEEVPDRLIEDLVAQQYTFPDMTEAFFRKIDWGDPEAIRLWPMGKDKRVVIDPTRNFGKPIDQPTGVATLALYEASTSGERPQTVATWFDAPLEAVIRAIEYETLLAAA